MGISFSAVESMFIQQGSAMLQNRERDADFFNLPSFRYGVAGQAAQEAIRFMVGFYSLSDVMITAEGPKES